MSWPVVAGIDVGGARKGFHAVALRGRAIAAKTRSCSAEEIAAWCREMQARVVAIDAPCRWSIDGKPRSAELALMRQRISCFSTPTEEKARSHPKNYYGWMIAGLELYAALSPTHEILESARVPARRPVCFEAFPQAIACRLADRPVSARAKNTVRRGLLRDAGVDESGLASIDDVDAAMCALMARLAVEGNAEAIGNALDGVILLPRQR